MKEFKSFQEFGRSMRTGQDQHDLNRALELCEAEHVLEAAAILERYDPTVLSKDDRHEGYAQCFLRAAKIEAAHLELQQAQRFLKSAIALGKNQWHVHKRLMLIGCALQGYIRVNPPANWVKLYAPHCRVCSKGGPDLLLCARCTGVLKEPVRPAFKEDIADHYAPGVYRRIGDEDSSNALSQMIRFLKGCQGQKICQYLGYILSVALRKETDFLCRADVLIPVPPDPQRLRERGFDNVAELAGAIESFTLLPLAEGVLLKTRSTVDLRSSPWAERGVVLDGSFAVSKHGGHLVQGAVVLLVDDTVTSGTTLNLCAALLKSAGAREVLAATLARSETTKESRMPGQGTALAEGW